MAYNVLSEDDLTLLRLWWEQSRLNDESPFNVNPDGTLSTVPMIGSTYAQSDSEEGSWMPMWEPGRDVLLPVGSQVCSLFDETGEVLADVVDVWAEGGTTSDLPTSVRLRYCSAPYAPGDHPGVGIDVIGDVTGPVIEPGGSAGTGSGVPGMPGPVRLPLPPINPTPVISTPIPPPPGSCCVPGAVAPPSTQQSPCGCGGCNSCSCNDDEEDSGWHLTLEIS